MSTDDSTKKTYTPVGYCIYCGSTDDLTDEHIIPFALNGSWELPKSSCTDCAKITGRIEQAVLRGPMRVLRKHRAMKSRSKHKGAPDCYPLSVTKGDHPEVVEIPLNEYPILLHLPIFGTPGFLKEEETTGVVVQGLVTIAFGQPLKSVLRNLDTKQIGIPSDGNRPHEFAQMIAKIAYAFAFAEGAVEKLENRWAVPHAILGVTKNIGRWVGTLNQPIRSYPNVLHRIQIHHDFTKSLIIVEVQLFADSQTPSYGVILGPVKSADATVAAASST